MGEFDLGGGYWGSLSAWEKALLKNAAGGVMKIKIISDPLEAGAIVGAWLVNNELPQYTVPIVHDYGIAFIEINKHNEAIIYLN